MSQNKYENEKINESAKDCECSKKNTLLARQLKDIKKELERQAREIETIKKALKR